MKNILTLAIFVVLFSDPSLSQQFEWVNSNAVDYDLNPSLPSNIVCVSDAGFVYAAHPDSTSLVFGIDIYGKMAIDISNTSGIVQSTIFLGNRVLISGMAADENGNVFVGGSYMQTLSINGTDTLTNTGNGFDTNLFLLCFDADGNLVFKRNVSLQHADYYDLAVITLDAQNNLWYGAGNFFTAEVFKTDASGNDVLSHELQNVKILGGISFDAEGNLYISGSASSPSITVGGLTVAVPETYMMFVTRINTEGEAAWVQLAHDITFQAPQVKADPWGNAYVSGSLFTATSFGTVSFLDPQWVYDVFITRVDKDGNFHWGVQAPQSSSGITGDFERGVNSFIDADDNGILYITGITRGSLDWGNGVTTNAAGISYGVLSVLSFDTSGNVLWALDGGSDMFNQAGSIDVNEESDCYFSGSITGIAHFDAFEVNIAGEYASVFGKISSGVATSVPTLSSQPSFTVYPNPASEFLNLEYFIPQAGSVKLELLDIHGRIVETFIDGNPDAGNHSIQISMANLHSGIYFLSLQSSFGLLKRKVVVS